MNFGIVELIHDQIIGALVFFLIESRLIMVSEALFGVSSTIIFIAIGYILGGANFFKEHEGGLVFTGFLNWVALPCYLFYSVFTNFDSSKDIIDVIKSLPIPLGVTLLNVLIGYFCAKLFKVQFERRGVFINAIGFTNIIFVGLPLISLEIYLHYFS